MYHTYIIILEIKHIKVVHETIYILEYWIFVNNLLELCIIQNIIDFLLIILTYIIDNIEGKNCKNNYLEDYKLLHH